MLVRSQVNLRRKRSPPLYRSMSYIEKPTKRTQEEDAAIRFYAMLSVVVPRKGRPTYNIRDNTWELKVKQPLEKAYYKMFQAMLAYPSNLSLSDLVKFTCHEVLYNEMENLKIQHGLQSVPLGNTAIAAAYVKKAKECRMLIHEETIAKFYDMLALYTPFDMRMRLWDEQSMAENYWEDKVKLPIREAFQLFIEMMTNFPTSIAKQKLLVELTLKTILPHCETAMRFRGLKFELTHHPISPESKHQKAVRNEDRDDMLKIQKYHTKALGLPSTSPEAVRYMETYKRLVKSASNARCRDVSPDATDSSKWLTSSTSSKAAVFCPHQGRSRVRSFSAGGIMSRRRQISTKHTNLNRYAEVTLMTNSESNYVPLTINNTKSYCHQSESLSSRVKPEYRFIEGKLYETDKDHNPTISKMNQRYQRHEHKSPGHISRRSSYDFQ